jgi:hypothetical protein
LFRDGCFDLASDEFRDRSKFLHRDIQYGAPWNATKVSVPRAWAPPECIPRRRPVRLTPILHNGEAGVRVTADNPETAGLDTALPHPPRGLHDAAGTNRQAARINAAQAVISAYSRIEDLGHDTAIPKPDAIRVPVGKLEIEFEFRD